MSAAEKVALQDIAQARQFVACLCADGNEITTFQTLDDKKRDRKHLIRIRHGHLDALEDALAKANAQGAGVYLMVNAGDGKGRREENVQRVRAYFLDLDGSPPEPVRAAELQPHLIVESSPGKWHAYWRVCDAGLDDFKAIQHALANRFAGDPSICDVNRVMRVPGFWHQKAAPFVTRIVERNDLPSYTHAEIVQWLRVAEAEKPPQRQIIDRRTLPATIPEGERTSTLLSLAAGFVRRGIPQSGVTTRLRTLNAERCQPPLPDQEVDALAASACQYGSGGHLQVLHALYDSQEFGSLEPGSVTVLLAYLRAYDGTNNGQLTVSWTDFNGRHGITRSQTFYAFRRPLLDCGILTHAAIGRLHQTGKDPSAFAINPRFLNSAWCAESTKRMVR